MFVANCPDQLCCCGAPTIDKAGKCKLAPLECIDQGPCRLRSRRIHRRGWQRQGHASHHAYVCPAVPSCHNPTNSGVLDTKRHTGEATVKLLQPPAGTHGTDKNALTRHVLMQFWTTHGVGRARLQSRLQWHSKAYGIVGKPDCNVCQRQAKAALTCVAPAAVQGVRAGT
jgi:hypothetical protein